MNAVLGFALQALVGVLVALVSVLLAQRRFYREKWWEKTYDAYAALLEALWCRHRFLGSLYDCEVGLSTTESREKDVEAAARVAKDGIARACLIGGFTLSPVALDAVGAYQKILERSWHGQGWVPLIEDEIAAAETCVTVLVQEGRGALGAEAILPDLTLHSLRRPRDAQCLANGQPTEARR